MNVPKSTPRGRSGKKKPQVDPLLKGARMHGANELVKMIREAKGSAGVKATLENVHQSLRSDAADRVDFVAGLEKIVKKNVHVRTLRQMLGDGPVPGRLPRPPGTVTDAARAMSMETLPGDFTALANATRQVNGKPVKIISPASEAAAKRLGFTLPELFQHLVPMLSRQSVKRDGHAGQQYNIFGVVSEIGLANSSTVRNAEDHAVDLLLRDMKVKREALPADVGKQPVPRPRDLPGLPGDAPAPTMQEIANLVMRHRPAPGLLDMELQVVRDSSGQLVTDRLRGIMNLRKSPPEFIIVSIGEAKSKSGSGLIIGQLIEDVRRLLKGFRPPSDSGVGLTSLDSMQVRFGPQLVVAWLSEKAPPVAHVASLDRQIAQVLRKGKRAPAAVKQVAVPPGSIYDDARIIAVEFQAALKALSAKN